MLLAGIDPDCCPACSWCFGGCDDEQMPILLFLFWVGGVFWVIIRSGLIDCSFIFSVSWEGFVLE